MILRPAGNAEGLATFTPLTLGPDQHCVFPPGAISEDEVLPPPKRAPTASEEASAAAADDDDDERDEAAERLEALEEQLRKEMAEAAAKQQS